MKIVLAAVLLGSSFAHSSVQAFLKKDPIVFYVQDDASNADATNIFYNLDVKARGTTILEKEFTTSTGNISFNCSYSRINLNSTCTIRIKRDENLDMSNRYMAIYKLDNTDDATELYLHTVKDSDGRTNFYMSEGQELSTLIQENYFTLVYFIKGDD